MNMLWIIHSRVSDKPHRGFSAHKYSADQSACFMGYPTAPVIAPDCEICDHAIHCWQRDIRHRHASAQCAICASDSNPRMANAVTMIKKMARNPPPACSKVRPPPFARGPVREGGCPAWRSALPLRVASPPLKSKTDMTTHPG